MKTRTVMRQFFFFFFRIFLALKVQCYKDDDSPLTPLDYVTTPPIPSHGLLDDVSVSEPQVQSGNMQIRL